MQAIIFIAFCFAPALATPVLQIVGGKDVEVPGTWPHQASLEFQSSGSHTCGAVLVSARWLVTAAHCIGSAASNYQIVLGQHDRISRQEGEPTIYEVESVIRHSKFSNSGSQGFPYDIGLIKLARDVEFNDFVKPIRMAASSDPDFSGYDCYITGWGRLYGFGPLPNVLQEANIDVLTLQECKEYWGGIIGPYHVCVKDKVSSQRGACHGDSGGPLVCMDGSSGEYTLVGVTSWGSGSCGTRTPSVYARISYFRDWIAENSGL